MGNNSLMAWAVRMIRVVICCAMALTCEAVDLGGYLTLSNAEGKQINAKILRVHRDLITIRLQSNQAEIQAERIIFDKASQDLIQQWEVEQAVLGGLDFGVSSKRFDSERKSSEARSWTIDKSGYSIRVKNSSEVAIDGMEAKYLIVVKRERIGRKKNKDHSIELEDGNLEFPTIPARQDVKVDTRGVSLREESMNPGWTPSYGGIESSEDEFLGIVVEFYWNGRLIRTESKPSALVADYPISKRSKR